MATRFLGHAFLQQLRLTQQLRLLQCIRHHSLSLKTTLYKNICYRTLIVRITDQEAGLEEKRQANKQLPEDFHRENKLENDSSKKKYISRTDKPSSERINENVANIQLETETCTEKDELLTADPDVFGNARLSTTIDEGDIEEEEYISQPTRRSKKLATREYAKLIKQHLNEKRLDKALEVLEVRMLREDRVKPENYIYNLLISGCAKAGYTRKAFSLFTKMRQRGLKVTGGTYTSLFNACANAPTFNDGLCKAQQLREIMLEKCYEPNVKNYNAMIKAYGRCGDVKTAYMLADEMRERQLCFNTDTYNFLLQACASDEKYGFRHCLLTWHKMLKSGLTPDYYTFNAVLRCVRDCGFGDLATMEEVLQQIVPSTENPQTKQLANDQTQQDTNEVENPFKTKLTEDTNEKTLDSLKTQLAINTTATDLELPNLLLPQPHLGSLVTISEITCPHERFLLLGGIVGFLELMKTHKITPDIQTFTTMLEVIPPTNVAEKQLLTYVRKIGLKADIDFFNILIKKRSMRFDYESAKEVLKMIRTTGLQPDIVTYGVLALGCQSQDDARELLQQMHAADVRMNIQILGAMLRQGCAHKSFSYVNEIMQISLDENIRPNDIFLRHLHNFYKQCARAIDARHPITKSKAYKKGHAKFCDKYRLYYEEEGLTGLKLEDAIKKVQEHPYQQYKETEVGAIEPLKNTDYTRKQKIRKYIKKIKIENLSDGVAKSHVKQLA